MGKKGTIFIVSGPSGAGKSTILNEILKTFPNLVYSVSYTTRSPRSNERNGVHYHFISKDIFLEKITGGEWAEWAEVHGQFYGTLAGDLNRAIDTGLDVILDIDVKGAKQLKTSYPEAVLIFITPPSMEKLRERLIKRGTDTPEEIERRLINAQKEMSVIDKYHYVIINDRLDQAISELKRIIERYHADKKVGTSIRHPSCA
nr:guanylate kinase [Desulfobacterales bacterium]